MDSLKNEENFFHHIANQIITFVSDKQKNVMIARKKANNEFSTDVDIGVEKLIVDEIKKRFPQDAIMAEESFSEKTIPDTRLWIIDPICGTNNLARDINNFCTNIALADKQQVIAACVIDHSNNTYIWSIGNKKIFVNHKINEVKEKRIDTYIDIDISSNLREENSLKEKQSIFIQRMILETNYYLVSLNSSLSFAYVAIGKIDGFVNVYSNPWDMAAASFLISESGGTITDLKGQQWTLSSTTAIAANNKTLHQKLLKTFND